MKMPQQKMDQGKVISRKDIINRAQQTNKCSPSASSSGIFSSKQEANEDIWFDKKTLYKVSKFIKMHINSNYYPTFLILFN